MLNLKPPVTDVFAAINYGANIVRYPIGEPDRPTARTRTGDVWKDWVRTFVTHLDSILPSIEGNVHIVLAMMTPPGGYDDGSFAMFNDASLYATFLEMWVELAEHYKDTEAVLLFDLCNEPFGVFAQVNKLYVDTYAAVRSVCTKRVLISSVNGTPQNFLHVDPVFSTYRNIWATAHFYQPVSLVFQGTGRHPASVPYPNDNCNITILRHYMAHLIDWKRRYNMPVLMGEFSIDVFGTEATRRHWLHDVIQIMETEGMSWTYHAFRESFWWNEEPYPQVFGVLTNALKQNSYGV